MRGRMARPQDDSLHRVDKRFYTAFQARLGLGSGRGPTSYDQIGMAVTASYWGLLKRP